VKQLAAASQKPMYRVADTAFSSVTINRNFQTALHMDDGDFREGYGNLSVIERGQYTGGATIFPRYKVGFNVRTGDFLAMDVHEWHCNTAMYETPEDKAYNNRTRLRCDALKVIRGQCDAHGKHQSTKSGSKILGGEPVKRAWAP
jgi:hypothetical protein